MSEYLVDIKNERISFFTPAGEVKALNDVSIHLREGEVLGIVGESGSGKSVTAYSLMGLTAYPGKLIGGSLYFNGHQVEEMTDKEMRKIRGNEISIIFQDPMTSLNPVYTIGNQIMEAVLLHTDKTKAQARDRAKELLELVGINEPEKRLRQYPHELSGGMRQRAALLRTYLFSEKVALLDEPFSALDMLTKSAVHDWYLQVMETIHLSTLFVTHDIEEAILLSDRIYLLTGTPGSVTKEIRIEEPRPRKREFSLSERFLDYKRQILMHLEKAQA